MDPAMPIIPRPIPPNSADPAPLLLGEALDHIRQIELIRLATKPVSLIAGGVLLLLGLWFYLSTVLALLTGILLALLVLTVSYLIWYGRFAGLNNEHSILCRHCTSRMWQLCCGCCREPVPPLALMFRGLFLSTCPHCNHRLSCTAGTLLAWCSTCSRTEKRPDRLYRKPMYLMVWMVKGLPDPETVPTNWQVTVNQEPSRMILYDNANPHSTCLLMLVDYEEGEVFDPHIIEHNRMLIGSTEIPQVHVERFRNHFPQKLIRV